MQDFSNAFYTYYSFAKAAPWGTASKPPADVSSEALETLRAQFFAGFEAYWGARSYNARDEHDGLYSVIYTAVTGNPGHNDPLWVVRRGPHELITWPVSNSRRLDIELRKEELECCDAKMAVMPLPPDESPDARFEVRPRIVFVELTVVLSQPSPPACRGLSGRTCVMVGT
jgi:hypothetical protein